MNRFNLISFSLFVDRGWWGKVSLVQARWKWNCHREIERDGLKWIQKWWFPVAKESAAVSSSRLFLIYLAPRASLFGGAFHSTQYIPPFRSRALNPFIRPILGLFMTEKFAPGLSSQLFRVNGLSLKPSGTLYYSGRMNITTKKRSPRIYEK